jgi:hypothetical protein
MTDSPAQRGAQWLLAQLQPDGSLRGAKNLGDYYKLPAALTITGHIAAAERALDYIQQRFLKADGDLDGSELEWFDTFCIYPAAWLAMGALMRGRFEMACPLLRMLASCHDSTTGAFFGTTQGRRERRGPQEMMSTCAVGLACLWGGREDIARRTGAWLRKMYDMQPDLKRGLYFVADSDGRLLTNFPAAEATAHFVDATQLAQWYFQYGIAAAFLSSLSAATGERSWLDLARQYLKACQHCREDVFRQPQSGKIGWGAAWTWRLTHESAESQLVASVTDGLKALQHADGWWSALTAYDYQKAERVEVNFDVTSEFVALLGCMELVPR